MIQVNKHFSLPRILTLGFIIIIVIGTLLLSLPIATNSGHSTGYLNELFTATSATCITGMTVVNTALHWSIFGKIVILILVEIGGLGFMTFAVLLFSFLRRKVDLTTSLLAKESLSIQSTDKVYRVVKLVIYFSLLIQGLGTALLFIDFGQRYGFWKGIGYSIFHSISAFCNAGFDLYANSLTKFAGDSYLLLVLSGLIITGSLGFLVWEDLLLFRQIIGYPFIPNLHW
ncbi:potassium uptake protein, integral membrane component, KtrB [Lentilactobacillus kosonis]|uniref:Potassium uptake protein, integral membrane component, KtrB n=1 Tax=Lentilactobacillus kosonis TaxID=2810561 RepID=A0A401FMI9_9LACO|nr:potassium uptake protein, integral membrane component, KtrB [Lentilactobacillus kosonis]